MARRKNTKRIDPRYFLHETTYRDTEKILNEKRYGMYTEREALRIIDSVGPEAIKKAFLDPTYTHDGRDAVYKIIDSVSIMGDREMLYEAIMDLLHKYIFGED